MSKILFRAAMAAAFAVLSAQPISAQTVNTYAATGLNAPDATAFDAAGNLYIANYGGGTITKVSASGGVSTFATGFQHPAGLAFDAGGALYVSDSGSVSEVASDGTVSSFYTPSGSAQPVQGPIAFDSSSGNLYVAAKNQAFSLVIEKISPTGTMTVLTTDPEISLTCVGIATDATGDVFYAVAPVNFSTSHNDGKIVKVTAGGVAAKFALGTFAQTLSTSPPSAAPGPLTIDASGNLYVYRYYDFATGTPSIVKLAPDGTLSQSYSLPTLTNVSSMTRDTTGNFYVADNVGNVVDQIVVVPSPLLSAVLPGSRSVMVGTQAGVFATMLNTGNTAATNCSIHLPGSAPSGLTLDYGKTDPTSNAIVGALDQPVTIAANGSQSFVLLFNSGTALSAPAQTIVFGCDGLSPAPVTVGINTVDLLFSTTPITDIIAEVATASGDGIVTVPLSTGGRTAFALATANVGAAGALTVSADTGGSTLPITVTLCQSNPSNAQCLSSEAASASVNFAAGATSTFSVFVSATGVVAFDPAKARIFVRFKDATTGASHGSTSVAVRTP